MSDIEKRGFIRIRDEFNVRVAYNPTRESYSMMEIPTSRSIDISAGGILIKTDRSLDIGEEVKISFLTPNSFDIFEGRGVIVRKVAIDPRTFSLAIQFEELTEQDRSKLDYYLRRAWEK